MLVLVLIVVGFMPSIFAAIDSGEGIRTESFTAASDTTIAEEFTVSNSYEIGSVSVEVNDVATTAFTETDNVAGTVTLDATASDVGYTVDITYQILGGALPVGVSTLLTLLPLLIAVAVVLIIVFRLRMKNV